MMEVRTFLKVSDVNLLKIIEKDLNEDRERLERQVYLFKEWIRCEPHLPKDIDDHLVLNFVRCCKCNLDKAKRKFENYLAARVKWRRIYPDYVLDKKYFNLYNIQREFVCHPKLTSDGYRVCFYRSPSIENFNNDQAMNYLLTIIELLLFENTSSGVIIVYDLKHFSPGHLAQVNIKNYLTFANLIYNISPIRLKHLHLFNLPKVAETVVSLSIKILNEKLSKRVTIHQNIDEMSNCLPDDILPDMYGGKGGDLDEYGDQIKEFLMHSDFSKKVAALQLAGPIPSNKSNLYSFEDFEMEGSFRKLNID